MTTIWKFPLAVDDHVKIRVPRDAKILAVQVQDGTPCIWALVEPRMPKEDRTFRIFGTGHPCDSEAEQYVGSFQLNEGALIFHVFEESQ